MKTDTTKLALALAALSFSLADPSKAQVAPAGGAPATAGAGNELSEIIVTARRVEERAQDVPISLTIFNQQQLADRNVVSAQDLADITPSLSVDTRFGNENTSFAIRGFVQDIGTQPSVGVYFADVVAPRGASSNIPIGDGAGPGSFFDLQNVQVLKGPQGTLFGRNTTGGAILLVPQKPKSEQEGYAEVSYGNFNMRRIQAVENIPLSDTARFRIGVDRLDRNGYTNNNTGIGPDHFEDVNYLALRASLVVDLAPNLENYTIFSLTHSNTTGALEKLVACDPTSILGAGLACPALARQGSGFYTVQNTIPDPFTRLTQLQLVNTTTWSTNDLFTVKNILSYAELKEEQNDMLFGTDFNLADFGAVIHVPLPSIRIDYAQSISLPGSYTAAQSTLTNELQLQGRSQNGRLQGQTGLYIEQSNPLAGLTGSQSPVLINCSNSANFQCADGTGFFGPRALGSLNFSSNRNFFHDFGVYAQGTYSLTEQLKLTGGARYTRDTDSAAGQLIVYKFPSPNTPVPTCTTAGSSGNNCNVSYDEKSSAPTWLVDLEYKPVEDLLSYIKYTRGYRAGGITLQAPTGFNTFRPEKVDTYEAGLKASFNAAVSGTFNVAGFYNDFRNQQLQLDLVSTIGGSPATSIFNAGKSRIYGAEAGGSITLFTGFSVGVDYTYLQTKIQSIAAIPTLPGSPYAVSSPAEAGNELTLSPKNKYNIAVTYALPLEEKIGHVSVGVNFTHTDKQISNYADGKLTAVPSIYALRFLSARNLLNAALNWKKVAGTPIDLSIFGTNLTNQQYYTTVSGNAGVVGFELAELGAPRMYGARLRYSW